MEPRHFTIAHLQKHLPWTLPYSHEFNRSQDDEGHRFAAHDVMHILKSLGKVAAMCEDIDHGRILIANRQNVADPIADLVICALHMAKTCPLGAFDLEAIVVEKLEKRNGVTIPPMTE
jgi:hypothetical protein